MYSEDWELILLEGWWGKGGDVRVQVVHIGNTKGRKLKRGTSRPGYRAWSADRRILHSIGKSDEIAGWTGRRCETRQGEGRPCWQLEQSKRDARGQLGQAAWV